jgi:hypothetical protein
MVMIYLVKSPGAILGINEIRTLFDAFYAWLSAFERFFRPGRSL